MMTKKYCSKEIMGTETWKVYTQLGYKWELIIIR